MYTKKSHTYTCIYLNTHVHLRKYHYYHHHYHHHHHYYHHHHHHHHHYYYHHHHHHHNRYHHHNITIIIIILIITIIIFRFDTYLQRIQELSIESTYAIAVLNLGQAAMFCVGLTSSLLIALNRVQRGTMSVGDLVAVNSMLLQVSLCKFVYIYVYIYTCIRTCICILIYVCIYVYKHIYAYLRTYIRLFTTIYIFIITVKHTF
jgi:cation transport ATPase